MKISTKGYPKPRFRWKIVLWSLFFIVNFFLWYNRFFVFWIACTLSLFLAAEVLGMVYIGYFKLSKKKKFPRIEFWSWVLFFSMIRFSIVYSVVQHNVPIDTVFRHPERAIYFIVATSAGFIFFGYCYSIYEWGLAAREKFRREETKDDKGINHPINIRSNGKTLYLMTRDIRYLEANGEYVKYICTHGNFMSFQRMKKVEVDLKKYGFKRIHRSYIVNRIHIRSVSSSKVFLLDNVELPVSKAYKEGLKKIILSNGD